MGSRIRLVGPIPEDIISIPSLCSVLCLCFVSSWRSEADKHTPGPVISFRAYLRRYVVLNTLEAVDAILNKRSGIYSDRPTSWMYYKLCKRENAVLNISASQPRHRIYRRMLHTGLNASAIREYWPLMQNETKLMVDGFLERPDLYEEHFRKCVPHLERGTMLILASPVL